MKNIISLSSSILVVCIIFSCQKREIDTPNPKGEDIPTSANTKVIKYDGPFLYGSNMGYLNSSWKDEDIADILAGNSAKGISGVGVNSIRPALYESFVMKYGYSIRLDAFKHYKNIGTVNNTIFIGDKPSEAHREKKEYAAGVYSLSYENIYNDIWDNGENGTPVNDNNHYALYVYNVVKLYGDNVKFWEIKNEPDFTYSQLGNRKKGEEMNWWDNDPQPKYLTNWGAPIQSYIRMLRVSYEVIKHIDPDAYVCIGGIGYDSFLDAILRNTDNPDGGKVTDKYPLKGGAWFDCLSYHCYPMYYMRSWAGINTPGNINGFMYLRNSDEAARIVVQRKSEMFEIMSRYGYNGSTYPLKEAIITETNLPSKQVKDYIGSQEVQRNFAIKVAVLCQQNGINGVYIYGPWESKEQSDASGAEYNYMGLYRLLPESPGQGLRVNEAGIAWKTMTSLLADYRYSKSDTDKLNLPENVLGGAFRSTKSGDIIYVLWAKTTGDLNETASAGYTFPQSLNVTGIYYKQWDSQAFSINGDKVELTGSPVFVKVNKDF